MSPQKRDDRLAFLCEVVTQESKYLRETDHRLFSQPMTAERAASLPTDAETAERVDAFVARFGRLQDMMKEVQRRTAAPPNP